MTGNDLAVRNGAVAYQQAALAISPGQDRWDATQLAALAQLGLSGASDGDLAVFLHVSQRTGLDPFSRQIYMINRREKVPGSRDQWRDKWTIQTGIDGFRVNRSRAEKDAGVRGILGRAVFYDPDGSEHKVWTRREPPVACEITYTVRDRAGLETPYTSVLRFSEYVQLRDDNGVKVPSGQWASKPAHMLEKCTEADVYRKAFPQDFSGFQLDDASPPPEDAPAAPQPPQRVTGEEIRNRRPPRQVRSQVVDTATGEVIPGGDADPRAAVLAAFDALGVAGPGIPAYLGRLAGKPLASVESLNRAQAQWFAAKLAPVTSRDELEALAVAAEARREQDNAAETPDGTASDE